MIQTNVIGSYTEIYTGGGNFITQNTPTNLHEFYTRKILTANEDISDFREVTATERTALEHSDAAWVRPPQTFIDHWDTRADGDGQYNENTGFFELNGLTSITYDEALMIDVCSIPRYTGTLSPQSFYKDGYPRCRTLFAIRPVMPANVNNIYDSCVDLVAVKVRGSKPNSNMNCNSMSRAFYLCTSLRRILGIIEYQGSASVTDAFTGCKNLEDVEFRHIDRYDITVSFRDCPKLSLWSLQRIVDLKGGSGTTTVVLHPTTFGRLTEDLIAAAVDKNIQFATV